MFNKNKGKKERQFFKQRLAYSSKSRFCPLLIYKEANDTVYIFVSIKMQENFRNKIFSLAVFFESYSFDYILKQNLIRIRYCEFYVTLIF